MASIKRRPDRGNKWQATYRDPEGKERARLFDRKVDADRWVAEKQHEMHVGTYVDPAKAKMTLGEYAATWLARMAPTWRSSSLANVTNSLRHVLPVLGSRPLPTLRRSDVEALYASLP